MTAGAPKVYCKQEYCTLCSLSKDNLTYFSFFQNCLKTVPPFHSHSPLSLWGVIISQGWASVCVLFLWLQYSDMKHASSTPQPHSLTGRWQVRSRWRPITTWERALQPLLGRAVKMNQKLNCSEQTPLCLCSQNKWLAWPAGLTP